MGYVSAHTLEEALAAAAPGTATLMAGGTDVYPALHDRPLTGDVVDLSRVSELRAINADADTVRIGGAVTWTEIIRADLPAAFDGLKAAAREVGAVQIQNRATLAGNLCTASPAADGVPCLLALNASVELASSAGRRTLALSDFILGPRKTALRPGEVMTAILIRAPAMGSASAFMKLGARRYLVISIAMVSAVVRLDAGVIASAAIAVGSCSPVAVRLPALEAAVVGLAPPAAAAAVSPDHLAALAPISDVRASADYRREAALELTRRAILTAAGSAA